MSGANQRPAAGGPHPGDSAERSLLERIARFRDVKALERLHAMYRPRLSGFLFRLTSDAGLVEEVYNDVMFIVWKKADQFSGRSKVSTWLFAIAYRKAIKMLKKNQRRVSIIDVMSPEALPDHGRDPRADCENRELIEFALTQLPAKQRMIVELSYFAGNTYEEIAVIAGCPVNTVKTRMFNARRRLNDIVRAVS